LTDAIFAALADSNDTAAVTLFVQPLHESPVLRRWLKTVFLEPRTRARLAGYLTGKVHPPPHATRGHHLLAWLANSSHAFDADVAALAGKRPTAATTPYGGLTRIQVIELIRRYQAGGAGVLGGIELASFLLAHVWR
jgi:hypothetical protein